MKIIRILTISFCIITILSNGVLAVGLTEIMEQGKQWEEVGENKINTTMDTSQISDASEQLYNIFTSIAMIVALIVGCILGIQFMTAGIDKKVEVQRSLIPYLISCVVAFGALGIWKFVISIFGNM